MLVACDIGTSPWDTHVGHYRLSVADGGDDWDGDADWSSAFSSNLPAATLRRSSVRSSPT
jgi:hypothetical protein